MTDIDGAWQTIRGCGVGDAGRRLLMRLGQCQGVERKLRQQIRPGAARVGIVSAASPERTSSMILCRTIPRSRLP